MSFGYLIDYEPDYDAMWDEYVAQDEEWVFYATHERVDLRADSGTSAQLERETRDIHTTSAPLRDANKADLTGDQG